MTNETIRPTFYSNHRIRNVKLADNFENTHDKQSIKSFLKDEKKNILEIGFGMGNSIKQMYLINPENYFCIESYIQGVNNLNSFVKKNDINNIFLFQGDAIDIVEKVIPDNSMDKILIYFPDPWPKNKHHKRRIINNYTLKLFFKKLKANGLFHFASDHINYAYFAKMLLSSFLNENILFQNHRGFRPITNYEKRANRKKNFIFDIIIKKTKNYT